MLDAALSARWQSTVRGAAADADTLAYDAGAPLLP